MSRIGYKPIQVKTGVNIDIDGQKVSVKGPKGQMELEYNPVISIEKNENELVLKRTNELKKTKALHGLYRALIANMVTGVSDGFQKGLEINGVGYRVQKKGNGLQFALGYSHTIEYPAVEGIEFVVESDTKLKVVGIDKAKVGQVAAELRGLRPPEPYKGKGIKYANETIRRKAGKAGKK